MHDELTIERLVLRMSDRDDAGARAFARDVVDALYERLRVAGVTGQLHLARVELRMTEPASAAAVAERIWGALR